jgi:hypothetical protein
MGLAPDAQAQVQEGYFQHRIAPNVPAEQMDQAYQGFKAHAAGIDKTIQSYGSLEPTSALAQGWDAVKGAAMAPVHGAEDVANTADAMVTEPIAGLVSKAAQTFPRAMNGPKIVPIPTQEKWGLPTAVQWASPGEAVAAVGGAAGSIAANPMNWMPGEGEAGGFENVMDPRHFGTQAQQIAKIPSQVVGAARNFKTALGAGKAAEEAKTALPPTVPPEVAPGAPPAAPAAPVRPNNKFESDIAAITGQRSSGVNQSMPAAGDVKAQQQFAKDQARVDAARTARGSGIPPQGPLPVQPAGLPAEIPREAPATPTQPPRPQPGPVQPADQFPRAQLRPRRAAAVPGAADEAGREVPLTPDQNATVEGLERTWKAQEPPKGGAQAPPEPPKPGPQAAAEPPQGARLRLGKPMPNAIDGAKTVIQTASGSHPAQYSLVDLKDVTASHDAAAGFKPDPDYPKGVQPRDYQGNKAYQASVLSNATPGKFDPAGRILDNGTSAVTGPPVVTKDGTVLSGNGRTMMAKLAQNNPATAATWLKAVTDAAPGMGISPEAVQKVVENGGTPAIVRVLDNTPATVDEARTLATETNQGISKVADPAEQAFTRGKQISGESLKTIAETMGDRDLDQTLATQAGTRDITAALVNDRALSQNELTGLINPKTGALTPEGAKTIKDALVARLTGSVDLVRALPDEFKGKLVKTTGELAKIEAAPDAWKLGDRIREALGHIVDQTAAGAKRTDWLKNQDMFKGLSDDGRALVKALSGKQSEWSERVATYAEMTPRTTEEIPGQESLFEAPKGTKYQPDQAFKEAFLSPGKPVGKDFVLASEVIPGARVTGDALQAVGDALAGKEGSTEAAKGWQDAATGGKGNLPEFKGASGGLKWLAKRFMPVAQVMPRIAAEYRRLMEYAAVTSKGLTDEMLGITQSIHGNQAAYNELIEKMEGRMALADGDKNVSDVATKLRALLDKSHEMFGKSADQYRENYFPHQGNRPQPLFKPWELQDMGFNDYIKPGETPAYRPRKGEIPAGYNKDVEQVLTNYFRRTVHDEVLSRGLRAWDDRIATMGLSRQNQSYYTAFKQSISSDLRNAAPLDKALDNLINDANDDVRKAPPGAGVGRRLANGVLGNFYSSFLGLRAVSGFKILGQTRMTAAMTSLPRTAIGIGKMLFSPEARAAYEASGHQINSILEEIGDKSSILEAPHRRSMVESLIGAQQWYNRKALGPVRLAEYFNRGVAYHAATLQGAIEKGLSGQELENYAKFMSDKAHFGYGKGAISPYLDNFAGKAASVFLHYPSNMALAYYNMVKERDIGAVIRLAAFDGMCLATVGKAGYSAAHWLGYEPLSKFPQAPNWMGGKIEQKIKDTPVPWGGTVGDIKAPIGPLTAWGKLSPVLSAGVAAFSKQGLSLKQALGPTGIPATAYGEYDKLARTLISGRQQEQKNVKLPNGRTVTRWVAGKQMSVPDAMAEYLQLLPEDTSAQQKAAIKARVYNATMNWLGQQKEY